MAADAALLGAAVLVWAAATAVVMRVRRTVLGRTLPELPLDSTIADRRVLVWGGVYALLGAAFTAIDIERGTLLLYCAGLTALGLAWFAQDNRQWWNARPPLQRAVVAVDGRYRLVRPAIWALLVIALFAWFAGWSLIGRLGLEALQG